MPRWTQRTNYQLCKLRHGQPRIPCSSLLGRSRGQKNWGGEEGRRPGRNSQAKSPRYCAKNHTVTLHPLHLQRATKNQSQANYGKESLFLPVDHGYEKFGFYLAPNSQYLCDFDWVALVPLSPLNKERKWFALLRITRVGAGSCCTASSFLSPSL